MKTAEFHVKIASTGQIAVPPEVASLVPEGAEVDVLLCWREDSSEDVWRKIGRARFEASYAPDDSIYEELLDR